MVELWDNLIPKYLHPSFCVNYGAAHGKAFERLDAKRIRDGTIEEKIHTWLFAEFFLPVADKI